jgi:hypothetical protein
MQHRGLRRADQRDERRGLLRVRVQPTTYDELDVLNAAAIEVSGYSSTGMSAGPMPRAARGGRCFRDALLRQLMNE